MASTPQDQKDTQAKPATDAPRRGIDADWLQWIAEQRLRNCSPASMLDTMTATGLPAEACRMAIAAVEADPIFAAARRHQQLHAKLSSVAANLQRLWELDPAYTTVERIRKPTREAFIERYVRGCRPVVIEGVADDWPAMQRWQPRALAQRFGHLDVEVQADRHADRQYERNKLAHRRTVRLADFIGQVLDGGPSNDCYLTANNEALRQPGFAPLLDDVGTLPPICDRSRLAACSSFWLGPAGTVTPLHHDTLMLFHTQLVGSKRWRFVSPLHTPRLYNHFEYYSPIDLSNPDPVRYPDAEGVPVLEVVAGPGDTVFLPLAWWHEVTALEVSVSFSYSNLDLPNHYTYANASISNW
jgi:hypothetical protein